MDTEKDEEVLAKFILPAIKGAGFDPSKVGIILDIASSDFFDRPDQKGFVDLSKATID